MKNKILFLIFFPFFISCKVYLEYGKSWGRFGDNVLSYMHTKYVAYKTKMPILYSSFIYSDQLRLSDSEERLKEPHSKKIIMSKSYIENNFQKVINLKNNHSDASIILEVPYFPEDLYENHSTSGYIFFDVEWDNPDFKNHLREAIAPKSPLKLIDLPQDKISIALHVRLGGSYSNDRENINKIPLKFPPLSFYVEGLEKIFDILGENQEYYVYIFTDEDQPKELMDYFKEKFPKSNITFDCRIEGNRHDKNVLEDFFSITKFDCCVHPLSNYTITAAKIADYIIEIEPIEFQKVGGNFKITKNNVKISHKLKKN